MNNNVLRHPIGLTVCVIVPLLALFVLREHFYPYPQELFHDSHVPIGKWLYGLSGKYPLPVKWISFSLMLGTAFLISRTVSRNMVYGNRTFLPTLIYIFLSCGIFFTAFIPVITVSSFILVSANIRNIESFSRSYSVNTSFRAAILYGILPLIYAPLIVMLAALPVGMAVFRRRGREILTAFLGSLIPIFLWIYINWATGGSIDAVTSSFWASLFSGPYFGFTDDWSDIGSNIRMTVLALTVLALIISIFSFFSSSGQMRTRAYKICVFQVWMLPFYAGAFLLSGPSPLFLALPAIPCSFLIPFMFNIRPRPSMILFIIFTALFVILNLWPFVEQAVNSSPILYR